MLLYLEELYETVNKKIPTFESFPEEIQEVLDKYIDMFDTKLRAKFYFERIALMSVI